MSIALESQRRLANAMIRLWARVEGQSHFDGTSQVVGTSISVGRRIFSIVIGLGFAVDRSRECELWLLKVPAPRLLRKRRMLEEA